MAIRGSPVGRFNHSLIGGCGGGCGCWQGKWRILEDIPQNLRKSNLVVREREPGDKVVRKSRL